MASEESVAFVDSTELSVRSKTPYFAEIVAFRPHEKADAIFQIEKIVGIEGDTSRGKKPFPHPFPARMPLEVAQAAVSALSRPGEVVLDPMVGSGVVARAALGLGRKAIGYDVDPLAIIQARALCAEVSTAQFESRAAAVLKSAEKIFRSKKTVDAQRASLDAEDRRFIRYWFHRKHADELFALSLAIDNEIGPSEWPVFAAVFSSLIISRGSGASRAMDLSRSRPHRVDSKVPKSPFSLWPKQVIAFRNYYERSSLAGGATLKVGDARELSIPDGSVDAVITSPPYLNAIDYIRTSKFSLIFLGSRLDQLRAIRSTAVGTEVGLATGHLSKSLEAAVDKRVSDPKRRPMVRRLSVVR